MKPTLNRLLVRVEIEAEVVKEGEESKPTTSMMTAEVLEVGPEVKAVKVKDVVVFAPYGVDEVVVGNEKLLIVNEDLVLAVHDKK